jgi:hypothetical protein
VRTAPSVVAVEETPVVTAVVVVVASAVSSCDLMVDDLVKLVDRVLSHKHY